MMTANTNPLTDLEETIRTHWLAYRPKMCAELEAAGKLEAAIHEAAERTRTAVLAMTDKGTPLLDAWEAVRQEWAILPAEDEEPEELAGPDEWGWDEEDVDKDEEPDAGAWLKRWDTPQETLAGLLEGGDLADPREESGGWIIDGAHVTWNGAETLATLARRDLSYTLRSQEGRLALTRGEEPVSHTNLTPELTGWLNDPVGQLAVLVWAVLEINLFERKETEVAV